jgi:hypothetical protein
MLDHLLNKLRLRFLPDCVVVQFEDVRHMVAHSVEQTVRCL